MRSSNGPYRYASRLKPRRPTVFSTPSTAGTRLLGRREAAASAALHHPGEALLERGELRKIVHHDVRIVGMALHEVLMVRLGGVEAAQRNHLRDDRRRVRVRVAQRADRRLGLAP